MGFSGGQSGISGANDVALNNPANNQYLSYNTGVSKWINTARPAIAFIVIWSGSAWQYKGSNISARPTDMITGDIIQFVGNPGGSLPAWATVNDMWTQG